MDEKDIRPPTRLPVEEWDKLEQDKENATTQKPK
jgi:hypothetical protein